MFEKFIIPVICLLVVISLFIRKDSEEAIDNEIQKINILISLGGDNSNREVYERHISIFNRDNPKTQAVPYFVYSDTEALLKLVYVKEANKKYDIAYLSPNQIYSLTKLNLIEPMDSYIMEDFGISWLEEFMPVSMANSLVDGKIWSIPIIRNARVALINENLFTYNQDAISLDDLVQLSLMQNSTEEKVELSLPLSELVIEYLAYNKPSNLAEQINRATYLNINQENKINMINNIRQAIKLKRLRDYSFSKNDDIMDFINGDVPILLCNTYQANKILDGGQFPISVLPLMLDSNTSFPLSGSNLYLVKQPSGLDYTLSWEALKALWKIGTDESEIIKNGNIPLKIPKINGSSYKNGGFEYSQLYSKVIQRTYNGYSGMAIDQNTKINLLLENALGNMLYKDIDVNEALEEVQNIINDILNN